MYIASITTGFVALPVSRFLMGGVPEDKFVSAVEQPQHEVKVGAFELARHPVTRGQWFGGEVNDPELPVTGISFDEAGTTSASASPATFDHVMKLALFKTLWGHDGDLASAIGMAREAGFEGIEGPVPADAATFFRLLEGIPWIAEVTTCTSPGEYLPLPHHGVDAHLASLEEGIVRSLPGGPHFITAMAGSDAWGLDDCLRFHERWWDVLLGAMRQRGMETATFTPESGPDGYLQCRPFTRDPVADLWDINRWLGRRQLDRHSPP